VKSAWTATFDAARRSGIGINEARRLTNVLIAAILTAGPDDDDDAIKCRVHELMMPPVLSITLAKESWWSIVDTAAAALMTDTVGGIDYDCWVREFQRADPSRKNLGAYATPAPFAEALAAAAVPEARAGRLVRIVDPACGAGALLIACLDRLHPRQGVARRNAALRLFGMELDPAARELACLHIWMAAGAHPRDLKTIAKNVRCGNALLHDWLNEEPYDVLVMDPPWESLRHKTSDPGHEADREATIHRMDDRRSGAGSLPDLFSAQGTGDRNLCKAFIELAPHLLSPNGRIAALIPGAFSSDEGMVELRRMYLAHFALEAWTSFENRGKAFDIDSRYKFGIIVGNRSTEGTTTLALRAFAVEPREVSAPHVIVNRDELASIGGPVGIIPDITSKTELDVLTTMLTSGSPFFADGEFGEVRYRREVDLTLGRHKGIFERLERRSHTWNGDGTMNVGSSGTFVPVLEGRMVGQYDFFQKSWVTGQGRTAVWRDNGDDPLDSCRPQFVARPMEDLSHRLAICDVTSATNSRTVHATVVPDGWVCGNTAPVLRFDSERAMYAGLAILNSLTFDWLARRMVSGLHLNKFYLSCMAWPAIGSQELEELASAGRQLAALGPRRPLGLDVGSAQEPSDLRASIEATVAAGYSLDHEALTFMLGKDTTDRRGFWRYYAAVPQALIDAQQAVDRLAQSNNLIEHRRSAVRQNVEDQYR
jgi:hypothetical protein